MIDIRKAVNFDWDSRGMKIADWVLAGASLAIGIYLNSYVFIAGGILGAAFAYFRPMGRLQRFINGMFVRRT